MSETPETPPRHASQLHAPWRSSYMKLIAHQNPEAESVGSGACFLETCWRTPEDDEKNHVILRTGTPSTGAGGFVMLNRYPYANGHLLVALGDGRQRLLDYSGEQRAELWSLIDLAVELCETTLCPQGVNVGINQGSAAGAGVPEHLHAHVVPRWTGDVNFITAVGNIRVIPNALEEMHERYRESWARIEARVRGS